MRCIPVYPFTRIELSYWTGSSRGTKCFCRAERRSRGVRRKEALTGATAAGDSGERTFHRATYPDSGGRGIITEVESNGALAIEAFFAAAPGTYDAILMDIQMPEMDGYEAARTIRADCRADAKVIPIIAMTANASEQDVKTAMEAGMDAHIAKPIDVNILYETLTLSSITMARLRNLK